MKYYVFEIKDGKLARCSWSQGWDLIQDAMQDIDANREEGKEYVILPVY